MRTDKLEKHIVDTVKEWQMKIGFQEGGMELYYPKKSLMEALEVRENLHEALHEFKKAVRPRLVKIEISHKGERYCLEVSEKGCRYIAEVIPKPEFLSRFLEVITKRENTMNEVRECFREYAKEKGTAAVEKNEMVHELGRVFYFENEKIEEYVYCVEENEFGLTYHRFSREDYQAVHGVS